MVSKSEVYSTLYDEELFCDNDGVLELLNEIVNALITVEYESKRNITEFAILLTEDDLDTQLLYNLLMEFSLEYSSSNYISLQDIQNAYMYSILFGDINIQKVLYKIIKDREEYNKVDFEKKYDKEIANYIILHKDYSYVDDPTIDSDVEVLLYKNKKLIKIFVDEYKFSEQCDAKKLDYKVVAQTN